MKKDDRSSVNPFTGKKHLDVVNDDKFLEQSYREYYNTIKQHQLLDDTQNGKFINDVAIKLINAVESYLSSINRSDYTENYYDWEFHLINYDVVNAFCMPGGKIVMYSGILSVANTEETAAFILAHEMAHALLDHSRTRISAHKVKNSIATASRLGSIGLSLVGLGELGSTTMMATNLADVGSEYLVMKPFGRSHEIEADQLGIKIIHWAGYDINHIPEFWERMSKANSNKFDFFSTHPSDSKRINAMNDVINEINKDDNPYNKQTLNNSPENTVIQENITENSCKYCGNIVRSGDVYCTNCGKKLDSNFICPNCGFKVNEEANFCRNCGFKLK